MDFSSHFCSLRLRKKLKLTHYHNQVIHLLNGMAMMKFQKKSLPLFKSVHFQMILWISKESTQWFSAFSKKKCFCLAMPPPQFVAIYLSISLIIMIESQSFYLFIYFDFHSLFFLFFFSIEHWHSECALKVKIAQKRKTERWWR